MSKYHVPVICEVEAESMEDARLATNKAIETVSSMKGFGGKNCEKTAEITLRIADDGRQAKNGQRVVLLHPSNTHSDYNQEEYEAELEKQSENGEH